MRTRFRSEYDKTAYNFIYDNVKKSINEGIDFSSCCSNIEIKNRLRTLSDVDRVNIAVDAIFDAINFKNVNTNTNKIINESILQQGKNINLYNCIYESVKLHRKTKKPVDNYIDEGLIAGALGALAGVSFGPAIGKAICNALGIGKGVLYDLMTSKLVNAAVCGKLGLRF